MSWECSTLAPIKAPNAVTLETRRLLDAGGAVQKSRILPRRADKFAKVFADSAR